MGRKARNHSAAMTWLPGFEPEGYESALLGIASSLMQPAVFAPPALLTREVASAASAVARSALIHVSQPASAIVMDALSVICDARVEDTEPVAPAPMIEDIAVADRHYLLAQGRVVESMGNPEFQERKTELLEHLGL